MSRTVGWFSAGAASAIACKLASPDIVAYCETGAEHEDNERFLKDCERVFGWTVTRLKSEKYADTWAVWDAYRFIAGIKGAPCTKELKRFPREDFQQPYDLHVFGYTADSKDADRADALRDNWPDLDFLFPLIERGLTKAACLALLRSMGITEPITYAMGFPHANCLPCPKATSPHYWALVRQEFPEQFQRMVTLSRDLGARLTRIHGKRIFIDEIPDDMTTTDVEAPACDFLCQIVEKELHG